MFRKFTLLFLAVLWCSIAGFAQNGFVSNSFVDPITTSSSTLGQMFSQGISASGYLNEGIQQSFLYRGADTILQENSTYPTIYRTAERNPLNTDYIVNIGLTEDSLYLLPIYGIDSLVEVMAYGVTYTNDTIVVAPYSTPTYAFALMNPIILPEGSVPPVQISNDKDSLFTVGKITPIVWKFRVANRELIDTQSVDVLFPPCGNDNFTVSNNSSYPYVIITPEAESFKATDAENNHYETHRIGYYCWTKENLKSSKYSDGMSVENPMIYQSSAYPNTEENLNTYGYLYTWNDALRCKNVTDLHVIYNDTLPKGFVQGICPEGWRVPSAEEMQYLTQFSNDELISTTGWLNIVGNNRSGFTALPGGLFNGINFENMRGEADFWSSTYFTATTAYFNCIKYTCPEMLTSTGKLDSGKSIRCLKN